MWDNTIVVYYHFSIKAKYNDTIIDQINPHLIDKWSNP